MHPYMEWMLNWLVISAERKSLLCGWFSVDGVVAVGAV
mgnify:CR=1 FL=1